MSQIEKLKAGFTACRGTFPYADFERLLDKMGYKEVKHGKTGGSRRKYHNEGHDDMIMCDEPHDGEMKPKMVSRLQEQLRNKGLL